MKWGKPLSFWYKGPGSQTLNFTGSRFAGYPLRSANAGYYGVTVDYSNAADGDLEVQFHGETIQTNTNLTGAGTTASASFYCLPDKLEAIRLVVTRGSVTINSIKCNNPGTDSQLTMPDLFNLKWSGGFF